MIRTVQLVSDNVGNRNRSFIRSWCLIINRKIVISTHHYQPNCFNSIFIHTVISILHDMEINHQLVIDNTRKACIFLQCTYDFYTDSTIDTREEHCQTYQMNFFLFSFALLNNIKDATLSFNANLFCFSKFHRYYLR